MEERPGYIYVTTHRNEPHHKFGKTAATNPLTRVRNYKTGASAPWIIEMLFRVPRSKLDALDNDIKKMLKEHNVNDGGGTEFFDLSPRELSLFKNMFLYSNPDCTEVDKTEIAQMELDLTRGEQKRRDRDNNDPDLVKIGPNGDSISKKTYERYMRTFEISRRTKRIHFAGKLNIKPFAGRNNLLERIPLDLEDVNSVKIWLDEVQYITTEYKDKYETGKGNKISDVTMGNGDLRALLKKYI